MKQMDEVKISKKSKVGILPFVAEFEEFAALAESIFKNAERRGDLDKAYIKLIRAVFVSGRSSEVVVVTKMIVSSYLYIILLQLTADYFFLRVSVASHVTDTVLKCWFFLLLVGERV